MSKDQLSLPRARRNSAPRKARASCAATPARCCAASGRGARAPARATPTRTASWCAPIRSLLMQRTLDEGGKLVAVRRARDWDGAPLDPARTFVTGIGAGTTYPDYKPAPFIVSAEHAGVDTVTVVTEGIFSYCGVKVKIDTDRHLGPETAPVRVKGEQVGHVTTAEYGSQMLSIGGVRHLTGGSKKEGNVTCDALLELCSGEAGGDEHRRRPHGDRRRPARRRSSTAGRRCACGSAAARPRSASSPGSGSATSTR